MMINRNKNLFTASIIFIILFFTVSLYAFSGCSLNDMIRTTYDSGSTLTLRDVDIDEKEVESIETLKTEMEKSF